MTTTIRAPKAGLSVLPSFQAIMTYNHSSLIERLKQKCRLTEDEASLLFDDTKRFLYLCADSNVPLSPPPAIDECWHHFILFTKDYARFCNQYFGTFLHHRPRYIDDPPENGSKLQNTLTAARKHFITLSENWRFSPESNANCDNCAGCQVD